MERSTDGGRVRTLLRDLIASQAEIEASEERRETELRGCTAVGDLVDRRRARPSRRSCTTAAAA